MTERDTKFKGFAKLLQDDLMDAQIEHYHDNNREDFITTLIAQRAYDLVLHVMRTLPPIDWDWPTVREWEWDICDIPDLTKWPPTE